MFLQNINKKTVLLSPLDWGLGHTTRCISIIRILLDTDVSVIVACNEKQKLLLKQEFPQIKFISLQGYEITYSKSPLLFPIVLLFQLPKILFRIAKEHRWLQKTIDQFNIDVVISDNRYGLYTKKVPCIIITHQLNIKAPFAWQEYLLQEINYNYINRFSHCWVPDFEGEKNIAGVLSHPKKLPAIPVHYIGVLARFKKEATSKIKYQFCILLSGPEPQRTMLENILLQQLPFVSANCLLVRGKMDAESIDVDLSNVTIKNHLRGIELNAYIQASEFIITRSGYTSVMELLNLQKRMILIPTPGQTEQEYLAKLLMQQQWAWCIDQKDFNLMDSLKHASNFTYQLPEISTELLGSIIQQFI